MCEDFRNKPNQSGEGNTLTTFQGVDTADEAVAQLKLDLTFDLFIYEIMQLFKPFTDLKKNFFFQALRQIRTDVRPHDLGAAGGLPRSVTRASSSMPRMSQVYQRWRQRQRHLSVRRIQENPKEGCNLRDKLAYLVQRAIVYGS